MQLTVTFPDGNLPPVGRALTVQDRAGKVFAARVVQVFPRRREATVNLGECRGAEPLSPKARSWLNAQHSVQGTRH
jgi:hypothetical protein